MSQETKIVKKDFSDTHGTTGESPALEELLERRGESDLKESKDLKDDGWKLVKVEKETEAIYTDLDDEELMQKAAQELAVTVEVIYTYVRSRSSGAGGSQKDKNSPEQELELEENAPEIEAEQTLEQENINLETAGLTEEITAESNLAHMIRYAENPLSADAPQMAPEEIQKLVLLKVAEMPSLSQQLNYIFAGAALKPDNALYMQKASAILDSQHLLNDQATIKDQQRAGLAIEALHSRQFINDLAGHILALSNISSPAPINFGNSRLKAPASEKDAIRRTQEALDKNILSREIKAQPQTPNLIPEVIQSQLKSHPELTRTPASRSLAADMLLNPVQDSGQVSAEKFAKEFKPVSFKQALFRENEHEVAEKQESYQDEMTYTEEQTYQSTRKNSLSMPTAPAPTASFYSDLGLTSSKGDGSNGGGFSSN